MTRSRLSTRQPVAKVHCNYVITPNIRALDIPTIQNGVSKVYEQEGLPSRFFAEHKDGIVLYMTR